MQVCGGNFGIAAERDEGPTPSSSRPGRKGTRRGRAGRGGLASLLEAADAQVPLGFLEAASDAISGGSVGSPGQEDRDHRERPRERAIARALRSSSK